MKKDNHRFPFPGFPSEPDANFWQYPKALNGWWHALTPTEQKVLDYILRHTWGYQKFADAIALSQFINGIFRKDGTVVDRGTGIKDERTVRRAIKGLVTKGFIEKIERVGYESIFKLKISSSQYWTPLTKNDTPPLTSDERGDSSQVLSPTIKDLTIKNNNSATRSDKNSSKQEITELISYLESKLGGIKFPIYGKQAKYANSMLLSGYTVVEIKTTINKMLENEWWKDHGFDLKNVAGEIPKLMTKSYKERARALHPRPEFKACGLNGCIDGYIENAETNRYVVCICFQKYQEELNNWKGQWGE